MILEFKLDYRSSALVYEKIFLREFEKHKLEGKILRDGFFLRLLVESEKVEDIEKFIDSFSNALPHSIFLYDTQAEVIEDMPKGELELVKNEKLPMPFCPKCLSEVMDKNHKNYYNIFTECEVCGYGIEGEKKNYQEAFQQLADLIENGKIIEIDTFYGKYTAGKPSAICNNIEFDIICYDLATVQKYTNAQKHEITSLGAIEKPLIKFKKSMKFVLDYEEIEAEIIRFKLPDDFVWHLLMEELHKKGVDAIFITKENISVDDRFSFVKSNNEIEPIEIVSSEKFIAIVKGEKSLPKFPVNAEKVNPAAGGFFSVIKEHNLKDKNIAGVYLSREDMNNILVYGEKFGLIEHLSINFKFESIKELFDQIEQSNESGKKIVDNYKKKNKELFEKFITIKFDDKNFNIYKLWGIVSIVLGYSQSSTPFEAAKALEDNAVEFMGEKGPRIDYKLHNIDGKVYLDPLMTVRTAMSFKLAGVDPLMLSFGVIESFVEFISNEIDELKQNMEITAVTASGSLLSNKQLFSKISKDLGINHNIYFNNQLPISGKNIFYGGNTID